MPTETQNATEVAKSQCYACEGEIEAGDEFHYGVRDYCETCYDERYMQCESCDDVTPRDDMWEYDGDFLCRGCYRQREEDRDNSDDEDSIPERSWSSKDLPAFQSSALGGTYITSPRKFSAEIEAYYEDTDDMQNACEELPIEYGVSHDGSLDSCGIEFQTPILAGEAGERSLIEACDILNKYGFTNNRTTGLHIHLDGKGLKPKTRTKHSPRAVKDLFSFYVLYEDVILSFLPPSRRRNRFCNLLKNDYHLAEIQNCNTLEQLEKLWYRTSKRKDLKRRKSEKYDSSRYGGVNFHSLLANGHIEIRYHSGTINAVKILEWVNLHQTILDRASEGRLPVDVNIQSLPELSEKTARFFEALQLPERARLYFVKRQSLFGVTRQDKDESQTAECVVVNDTHVCAE